MKEFEYVVQRKLDKQTIEDILCTAVEGGIGYWACLDNTTKEWVEARNELRTTLGRAPYLSEVMYHLIEQDKPVVLIDEEENKTLHLTWEKLQQGCRKFEEDKGVNLTDYIEDGNFDAVDADMVIQYSLFDEVVYG